MNTAPDYKRIRCFIPPYPTEVSDMADEVKRQMLGKPSTAIRPFANVRGFYMRRSNWLNGRLRPYNLSVSENE